MIKGTFMAAVTLLVEQRNKGQPGDDSHASMTCEAVFHPGDGDAS